jgi:thioester reductase-like protein
MDSLIAYLEHGATVQPDERYGIYLDVHGNETESYTYRELYQRTHLLAEYLSRQVGIKCGDRALLVYPPGLEIIVAFLACARIGVIPVPVYPPPQASFDRGVAKLAFIVKDCDARAALTTHTLKKSYEAFSTTKNSDPDSHKPALANLGWIVTDELRGRASEGFHNNPHPILFLQYTSGSTSDPKGVIVSHENVIHNCLAIADHRPRAVSWLPQYHDMGLIGYYLFPLVAGGSIHGFSPTSFLKRPLLWLETMSRVRATCSSAPNFGFDYCLREDKVPTDQLAGLDLSSLGLLMNASEPARSETYKRFLERFAPYGLRPEAHVVAYGLAENTLAVTNYGKRTVTVNKNFLQTGTLRLNNTGNEVAGSATDQLHLASCGRPLEGMRVRIVQSESGAALGHGRIGEVWVAGKSTCQGYWNRPELTQEVFGNRITNDPDDHHRYLRTGDLGFLDDGELFVCGRIKDLIIIRGVNYYPQDIEQAVASASAKIRSRGVVAFEATRVAGAEANSCVVVAEVKKINDLPDPNTIIEAVFAQCSLRPDTIVFVPPRTIAKTTSGKIARRPTGEQWLAGKLRVLATHVTPPAEIDEAQPLGPGRGFNHFLRRYNLNGNEQYTLAALGIDSLDLVSLLDDIEAALKQHGLTDLLSEIDGRLIQRLTIAELSSLFDQFETASDERISTLQSVWKKLRQEHDQLQNDRMRSDATLHLLNFVETAAEPLTNVLLTGPTGFFGPFLLNSLLRHTPYTYYTLTRANDTDHGMDRIRDSLRRAHLWTPTIEEQLKTRIHIVCGDISQHNLGLQTQQWQSLTKNVQAVIHNAALVNYVLNYDALRPHNVEGTRELLRFAATATNKEFHLISSTVIFGWSSGKRKILESHNNEEMLNLDFGYAQTKWVAEQLVFAAERQGLNVLVYRPAFITASAAGAASNDDIVIRLFAFMISYGMAVKAENQISFLPAEIVADNIATIFNQRPTTARTFHITADTYYNMMDITRLITREYGYDFVYYDIREFAAEMKRLCPHDNLLYPLLDFFNRSQEKIAAMQQKRYNNDNYREARRLSGRPSEPTLAEIVSYLMAYMRREGLIRGSRSNHIDEIEARVDEHQEDHVQQKSTPRIGRLDASVRPVRS